MSTLLNFSERATGLYSLGRHREPKIWNPKKLMKNAVSVLMPTANRLSGQWHRLSDTALYNRTACMTTTTPLHNRKIGACWREIDAIVWREQRKTRRRCRRASVRGQRAKIYLPCPVHWDTSVPHPAALATRSCPYDCDGRVLLEMFTTQLWQ